MISRPLTSGSTLISSSGTFQTPHRMRSCAHEARAVAAVYRALEMVQTDRLRTAESGSGAGVRGSSGIGGGCLQQSGELALRRRPARGHAVPGPHALRRLVAGEDLSRDRDAVDLVGPVVHTRRARVAVHLFQRHVGRVAPG